MKNKTIIILILLVGLFIIVVISQTHIHLWTTICQTDLPPKPLFSNSTGDYYMGQSSFHLITKCEMKFFLRK